VIYVYIIYTQRKKTRGDTFTKNQLATPLKNDGRIGPVGMMILPKCFWKVIQNSMVPKHQAAIVYPIMSPLNPIELHFLVAYLHQSNLKKESKYLIHPTRQSDFQATHDGQHQNSQGTHVPLLTFLPQKKKHDLAFTIQNGG